jgi:hypothetical protein
MTFERGVTAMRNHRIVFGVLALLAAGVCSAPTQATDRGKGVNFPVSCSASAQQVFNEALAALHSFWYAQAAKEFRAIAEREPDCAMAHWGYAMSLRCGRRQVPARGRLHRGRHDLLRRQ